jgi:hypothetical protein
MPCGNARRFRFAKSRNRFPPRDGAPIRRSRPRPIAWKRRALSDERERSGTLISWRRRHRDAAHRHLINEVLEPFGGRIQTVLAHWAESGRVTSEDLSEAEETLRSYPGQERTKGDDFSFLYAAVHRHRQSSLAIFPVCGVNLTAGAGVSNHRARFRHILSLYPPMKFLNPD